MSTDHEIRTTMSEAFAPLAERCRRLAAQQREDQAARRRISRAAGKALDALRRLRQDTTAAPAGRGLYVGDGPCHLVVTTKDRKELWISGQDEDEARARLENYRQHDAGRGGWFGEGHTIRTVRT